MSKAMSLTLMPRNESATATVRLFALGLLLRTERSNGHQWETVETAAISTRARDLLACLLSHPSRRLVREQLIEILWPEGEDLDMMQRELDRCVHETRKLLEPERGQRVVPQLLRQDGGVLWLADQRHLWLDADAFDDLLSEANAAPGTELAENLLESALELYETDFFPAVPAISVVSQRRATLRRKWHGALLTLADLQLAAHRRRGHDLYRAMGKLEQLLLADPADEDAAWRLLLALAYQRRRVEALQLYQRFLAARKRLRRPPLAARTRALARALWQGYDDTLLNRIAKGELSDEAGQEE